MTDPKKPVEQKEETVTVLKSQWDDVLKTVSMLKEVADLNRVANYEAKHKLAQKLGVSLIEIGGKAVVSHRMGKDNGKEQTILLKLEDGKEIEMPYGELTKVKKIKGTVAKRVTEDDKTTLTVELSDGRKIQMSEEFVNAV